MARRVSLADVDWSRFPPVLPDDGWLVVKVQGAYEAIEPLIPDLKADSFRYRDMSRSGGSRTWDRAFRMNDLADGFLIDSPWVGQAKVLGTTGITVQFFDGLETLRAAGEIVGGHLVMTSSAGVSTEFDITHLRSTLAERRGPVNIDSLQQ
jgi:hypothetical protein